MANYSKSDVVLVDIVYSDLSASKVRPAIIVNGPSPSRDLFLVPLTSQTGGLLLGEFILSDWSAAGLKFPSAVKRGVYTVHSSLVLKVLGRLSSNDAMILDNSLRQWLQLP